LKNGVDVEAEVGAGDIFEYEDGVGVGSGVGDGVDVKI
jgi:hypothetical protein